MSAGPFKETDKSAERRIPANVLVQGQWQRPGPEPWNGPGSPHELSEDWSRARREPPRPTSPGPKCLHDTDHDFRLWSASSLDSCGDDSFNLSFGANGFPFGPAVPFRNDAASAAGPASRSTPPVRSSLPSFSPQLSPAPAASRYRSTRDEEDLTLKRLGDVVRSQAAELTALRRSQKRLIETINNMETNLRAEFSARLKEQKENILKQAVLRDVEFDATDTMEGVFFALFRRVDGQPPLTRNSNKPIPDVSRHNKCLNVFKWIIWKFHCLNPRVYNRAYFDQLHKGNPEKVHAAWELIKKHVLPQGFAQKKPPTIYRQHQQKDDWGRTDIKNALMKQLGLAPETEIGDPDKDSAPKMTYSNSYRPTHYGTSNGKRNARGKKLPPIHFEAGTPTPRKFRFEKAVP